MKHKFVLAVVFFLLYAIRAYADCVAPDGIEGSLIYNGDYHVMQYCNGASWIAAGSPLSGQTERVAAPTSDRPIDQHISDGIEVKSLLFLFALLYVGFVLGVLTDRLFLRSEHKRQPPAPPRPKARNPQSGSIFTILLAAIAIAAALSTVLYSTISGPMSSMMRVTNKTQARSQMQSVASIIIMDAVNNLPNNGDCAAAGFVVPRSWRTGTVVPTGGGLVPSTIGAPLTDPWGTDYGYCVWEVGVASLAPGCDVTNGSDQSCAGINGSNSCSGGAGSGYNAKRLLGSPTPTAGNASSQTVLAIISAGPDRQFQSSCSAYVNSSSTLVSGGGDDIVLSFTYQQAATATSSLWTLKPSDSTKAVISKNLEIGPSSALGTVPTALSSTYSSGGIINAAAVVTQGAIISGGSIGLAPQTSVTSCVAGNAGNIRYNTINLDVEVCNGTAWTAAVTNASVALSSIVAATTAHTIDSTTFGSQVWNWSGLATGTAMTLADTDASATTATTLAVNNAATGTGYGLAATISGASNTGYAVYGINSGTTNTGAGGYFTNSGGGYALITGAGNVGIGTATPGYKLDVNGAGRFSGGAYLGWDLNLTQAQSTAFITTDNSATTGIQIAKSGGGNINTIGFNANTTFMTGNVGIGTTTPGANLELAASTTSGPSVNIKNASTSLLAGNTLGQLNFISNTSFITGIAASIAGLATDNGADYAITFNTTPHSTNILTEDMRILTNGNVVINGAQSYGYGTKNLDIQDTAGSSSNPALNFVALSPTAGSPVGTIAFYNSQGPWERGSIALTMPPSGGNNASGDLAFYTATTTTGVSERMRVNYQGNVGIGTTSPAEKLDLAASGSALFEEGNSNAWGFKIRTTDFGSGNVPLQFIQRNSGTDTEVVRITQGGNVGIGTTAPGYKLEVNGTLGIDGTVTDTGETVNGDVSGKSLIVTGSGTYTSGSLYSDGNWGMIIRARQASPGIADFDLENSAGTSDLRLDASGNMSTRGLVNATNYLQVNSKYAIDGTDSWLRLNQQNSFTNGIYTPGAFRSDGGYYGGGTINLRENTVVAGNLTVNGAYIYQFGATGNVNATGGPFIYADANNTVLKIGSGGGNVIVQNYAGTNEINLSAAGNITLAPGNPTITSGGSWIGFPYGIYGYGGPNYFGSVVYARNSLANDSAAYLTIAGGTSGYTYFSGNVGIGTASPGVKLEVNGGGVQIDDRGDSCCAQFVETDNGLATHFYTYNSGDFQIHKYGTGSLGGAAFTILNAGNVGIGTTGPTYKLDVSGAHRIVSTGSGADDLVLAEASYPNIYRWKLRTTDRGGGIDLDFNGTDGSDTATLIASLAIPASARSALYVNGNVGINTTVARGALDVSTTNNNIDGLVIDQHNGDNTHSIQTYIDNHWSDRTTYASACCNGLLIQPDAGYVTIYGPTTIGNGNASGSGVTIPGTATFNGAANFNGTVTYGDGPYSNGWFRNNNNGNGLYNQSTDTHWYSDATGWWNQTCDNNAGCGTRYRVGYASTIRGSVYGDTSNFGLLNNAGNWGLYIPYNTQNVYVPGDIHAGGNLYADNNNLHLGYINDWISNRLNQAVLSSSSPTFANLTIPNGGTLYWGQNASFVGGNGDAANFSTTDDAIQSWWSIGFRSNCCGNPVNYPIVIDTRAGNLFAYGSIGIGTDGPRGTLDVSTTNNGVDGLVIDQHNGDNTHSIQTYIDNQWAARTTYASACCNALFIQPDAGYAVIYGPTVLGSGNASGSGVTINGGETVNGAATYNSGPYTNDWFRVNGSNGIYWQTWGGGWYMTDSTFIRSYNGKNVYVAAGLDADGGLGAGCGGGMGNGYTFDTCGTANVTGNFYARNGAIIGSLDDYIYDAGGGTLNFRAGASGSDSYFSMYGNGNFTAQGAIYAGGSASLCTNCGFGYYQDATNGAYRAIVGSGTTNGYYFQTNGGGSTTLFVGLGGSYNSLVGIDTMPVEQLDVNGSILIRSGYVADNVNGLHEFFNSNAGYIQSLQNGTAWRQLNIDGAPILLNSANGSSVESAGAFQQAQGAYLYPGCNNGCGNYQGSWYLASSSSWGLYTNTNMYLQGGVFQGQGSYIYPGRADGGGNGQQSWFLASHGSYGLYTNTGLYVAGTLVSANNIYAGSAIYATNGDIYMPYNGRYMSSVLGWNGSSYNPTFSSLTVSAGGGLGLYTTGGAIQTDNTGNAVIANNGNGIFGANIWCGACGHWMSDAWSDIRLKDDVKPVEGGLDTILKLKPVSFYWKKESRNHQLVNNDRVKARSYGFIAQDVERLLPDVVTYLRPTPEGAKPGPGDPKEGYLGLDYNGLISPLVKAVQELYGKWSSDHSELAALKADNDNLRSLVIAQGRAIEELKKAQALQPHYRVYSAKGKPTNSP